MTSSEISERYSNKEKKRKKKEMSTIETSERALSRLAVIVPASTFANSSQALCSEPTAAGAAGMFLGQEIHLSLFSTLV